MNDSHKEFIGLRIEQVRSEYPEFDHFVGRKGTVDDAFTDEKGQVHVHTKEDGVWCPLRLVSVCETFVKQG